MNILERDCASQPVKTAHAGRNRARRNKAADFDLHENNAWPSGIVWVNGRFLVVDRADDKVYAYTATGRRDTSADFELHRDNVSPEGITWVNDRFHVVDFTDDRIYSYDHPDA